MKALLLQNILLYLCHSVYMEAASTKTEEMILQTYVPQTTTRVKSTNETGCHSVKGI